MGGDRKRTAKAVNRIKDWRLEPILAAVGVQGPVCHQESVVTVKFVIHQANVPQYL